MRKLLVYLIGIAAILAFIGGCFYVLFWAYYGLGETLDLADLSDAPFDVSDRIVIASGTPVGMVEGRHHNAGGLFLACAFDGGIGLILRVKLQVEEGYLNAGAIGKGDIRVWARSDDLLKDSGNGAEFQPMLTLVSRKGLDTVVSPVMEAAALVPLATSFGVRPPEQVSVNIWETGTHMAGVVTAQEINDFLARCR